MLSRAALDRVFDPLTPGFREDFGSRPEATHAWAEADALLDRLARRRNGQDQLAVRFDRDELERIRRFLAFACQARSLPIRTRLRPRGARRFG